MLGTVQTKIFQKCQDVEVRDLDRSKVNPDIYCVK
jgi:hypothetical protein